MAKEVWALFLFVAVSSASQCRERNGIMLPQDAFNMRTCSMCYGYLFPKGPLMVSRIGLVPKNVSDIVDGIDGMVLPDPTNSTVLELVCRTLSTEECVRWKSCCSDGVQCCETQLQQPAAVIGQCPITWDGYSCWTAQAPGTVVNQRCPSFLALSVSSSELRSAEKICTKNATWFAKEDIRGHKHEWTDYTPCLDKSSQLVGVHLCISLNVISVLFIIPAVIIFLVFRNLRLQNRVRVHVHLLIALGLCSFVTMLWYALVHRDLFVSPNMADTIYMQNPIWCQVLAIIKLYLSSSTYWWMLCEGIYLHRLLVNAFNPPKSLALFCVLGWGCSALFVIAYAAVRGPQDNEHCWAKNFGHYEWIVYAPNLFCLIVNLITLVNILRILLFKMHSHPHEPNSFRRGVKAAFMLIPLFGLQMLVIIYRPDPGFSWETEYEYFTHIVTNSQGIFVSVIFCYLNGEVLSNFRRLCPCCARFCGPKPSSVTNTSHFTMATDDTEYTDNAKQKFTNDNGVKNPGYYEMTKLPDAKTQNGDKGKYEPVPTML